MSARDGFLTSIDVQDVEIPASLCLEERLKTGSVVMIAGVPIFRDKQFEINFHAGYAQTALKITVSEKVVARTCRTSNGLESYETHGKFTFADGDCYQIQIECESNQFVITECDRFSVTYKYRIPLEAVTHLEIVGGTTISNLSVWNRENPATQQINNPKLQIFHTKSKIFDRNLIQNPLTLVYFWETSGPLSVEKTPVGVCPVPGGKPLHCVATSHKLGKMCQTVDLWKEGLTPKILELCLPFKVLCDQMYSTRFDCSGELLWKVEVLNTSKEVVKKVIVTMDVPQSTPWKWLSRSINFSENDRTIISSIRYIKFTIAGKDTKFWEGFYGTKFAKSSVVIKLIEKDLSLLSPTEVALNYLETQCGLDKSVEKNILEARLCSVKDTLSKLDILTIQNIVNYVNNGQESVHKFGLDIQNIVLLKQKNEANFDQFCKEEGIPGARIMYLWHGTEMKNLSKILMDGFQLPTFNAGTKRLQGQGLYFADRATKSAQYCEGKGRNVNPKVGNDGVLLLCEVLLGNIYYATEPDLGRNECPYNYHSVACQGKLIPNPKENQLVGSGILPLGRSIKCQKPPPYPLEFNEYIVYSKEQVKIRAVVHFQFTCNAHQN